MSSCWSFPLARADQRRGIQRERDLVNYLRDHDWFAMRAPASLGVADIVALRRDRAGRCEARLIEVKSTKAGPYAKFGPAARQKLAGAAYLSGAQAYLAWWPKHGELVWIPAKDWPKAKEG